MDIDLINIEELGRKISEQRSTPEALKSHDLFKIYPNARILKGSFDIDLKKQFMSNILFQDGDGTYYFWKDYLPSKNRSYPIDSGYVRLITHEVEPAGNREIFNWLEEQGETELLEQLFNQMSFFQYNEYASKREYEELPVFKVSFNTNILYCTFNHEMHLPFYDTLELRVLDFTQDKDNIYSYDSYKIQIAFSKLTSLKCVGSLNLLTREIITEHDIDIKPNQRSYYIHTRITGQM